jgi:hypothetical protein
MLFRNAFLWLMLATAAFFGCKGIKRASQGTLGMVLVVMDSTRWTSASADAIYESFGRLERTVPQPEPIYDLQFYSITKPKDIDFLKKQRNLIIAATLDENTNTGRWVQSLLSPEVLERVKSGKNFAFPLTDRWALDQWVMVLVAPTDSALAMSILDAQEGLISGLDEVEFKRQTYELFRNGERKDLADSLWTKYGFRLRLQQDYKWNADTAGFVSFNRHLDDNMRWVWVHWKDNFLKPEKISAGFINPMRDSLMKIYVRGTRDSSFVKTEYFGPIKTKFLKINGRYAMETRGLWRMENDLMGGPFVNYTIYDEYQHRLYLVEFAQFAPKYKKMRFVRQFEVMGRSFESDTTRKPLGR